MDRYHIPCVRTFCAFIHKIIPIESERGGCNALTLVYYQGIMKQKVLAITDFSASSRNALAYIGQLLDPTQYCYLLIHIYSLPVTYTIEGVALASVGEAFQEIEDELNGEMSRMQESFPDIEIESRYIMGGLIESLRDLIEAERPEVVVFGARGSYTELGRWDSAFLHALRNLPAPVLLVPQHISFKPVKKIGFACDYKNICVPKQVKFLRNLIHQTQAQLHIVHVTRTVPDNESLRQKNEALLKESLQDIEPVYHTIENPEVIQAIDQFIKDNHLDILIVIPRRHEFWYSLMHKSHIKQLAFLNCLPLIALPA
jgi:hypothetical protein